MSLKELELAMAGIGTGKSYVEIGDEPEAPSTRKDSPLAEFLERLGFQKYLFVFLFTAAAFGLTMGAYTYEQRGGLAGPALHRAGVEAGGLDSLGGAASIRRPVSQAYLFPVNHVDAGNSKGISFFEITGQDTVKTAGEKLETRGFALSKRDTDDCRFAYLTGGEALRDVNVVDRILRRNDACCDVSGDYRKQLEVYNFVPASKGKNKIRDSLRGALVFSGVSGELLAVYVKVRQSGEGSFEAVARRMADEYGRPVRVMSGATYWERAGSLLALAAGGGDVAVSVLHAANIDRHADRLLSLVEERRERERRDAGKFLAQAGF